MPYRDHPVEYPPVIGGLMWMAAEVTSPLHGGGADAGGTHATTFFNVTALGLAACALISTWTIAQLAGRRADLGRRDGRGLSGAVDARVH